MVLSMRSLSSSCDLMGIFFPLHACSEVICDLLSYFCLELTYFYMTVVNLGLGKLLMEHRNLITP